MGATVLPANVAVSAPAGAPAAAPAIPAPSQPDGLPPHLATAYSINPQMLQRFDESITGWEKITAGIESQPDVDDYVKACGNSGVKLIAIFCTRSATSSVAPCRAISSTK